MIYLWGQTDRLRAYRLHDGKLDQAPYATRPELTQGHPGAMMSLSANGNQGGILWAAIHASGNAWHESRPGILHAYDADDIQHELWNSLENAPRDDCNNYAKTAPPTIANGRVYLASFGTRNTGSGQLCVYGLLPDGAALLPPANVNASVGDGQVSLTWAASPDTTTYTVKRTAKDAGEMEAVARGLTSNDFTDLTAGNGVTYQYTVTSANHNGESMPSDIATVSLPKPQSRYGALPPGPGRDITIRVCSGCHSPALAASEQLSPQGWHDLVQRMAARGAVATVDEFNRTTSYLSRSFPKDDSTRKENK